MSLDVYLYRKGVQNLEPHSAIFIREGGQTKEITRAEWDERFPGREPVTVEIDTDDEQVYGANITHNLNRMAREAGLYQYLWRPEEVSATKAIQLIEPLRTGLFILTNDRARFEKFNPENGWGDYDGLVSFVGNYLYACARYPDADVRISR